MRIFKGKVFLCVMLLANFSSAKFLGASTFRVLSYNPENVFDQRDDKQNEGYGNYRIRPNSNGFFSNYGEPFTCPDRVDRCTFTDIKIRNIEKVLKTAQEDGPEIVALQEIENSNVTKMIFQNLKKMGYKDSVFSSDIDGNLSYSVGVAIFSKFPIVEKYLVYASGQRPILKVVVQVNKQKFVVYNNHWKSKGSPESHRVASAKAIVSDIKTHQESDELFDYVILGDLNSNYNEKDVLQDEHNDTNGITGVNDILKTVDAKNKLSQPKKLLHYNLHYELDASDRKTAHHDGFGWSTFDQLIVGASAFDRKRIDYMDQSFNTGHTLSSYFEFLFDNRNLPKRWQIQKSTGKKYLHRTGGFSDHLPVLADFEIIK